MNSLWWWWWFAFWLLYYFINQSIFQWDCAKEKLVGRSNTFVLNSRCGFIKTLVLLINLSGSASLLLSKKDTRIFSGTVFRSKTMTESNTHYLSKLCRFVAINKLNTPHFLCILLKIALASLNECVTTVIVLLLLLLHTLV